MEVDPTRLDKSDDIKKNWKYARQVVNDTLEAIFKSKDKIPAYYFIEFLTELFF